MSKNDTAGVKPLVKKKTTIQVDEQVGVKLKSIKKVVRLPLGVLADIGLTYVEEGLHKGELIVQNGRIVRKAA